MSFHGQVRNRLWKKIVAKFNDKYLRIVLVSVHGNSWLNSGFLPQVHTLTGEPFLFCKEHKISLTCIRYSDNRKLFSFT